MKISKKYSVIIGVILLIIVVFQPFNVFIGYKIHETKFVDIYTEIAIEFRSCEVVEFFDKPKVIEMLNMLEDSVVEMNSYYFLLGKQRTKLEIINEKYTHLKKLQGIMGEWDIMTMEEQRKHRLVIEFDIDMFELSKSAGLF